MKKNYTVAELRRELKAAGAKIRTKKNSEFISATITNMDGESLTDMLFRSSEEVQKWREKNAAALAVIDKFKNKTFDGFMPVIM